MGFLPFSRPDSPPLSSSMCSGSRLLLRVREELDHHHVRVAKNISKEGQPAQDSNEVLTAELAQHVHTAEFMVHTV